MKMSKGEVTFQSFNYLFLALLALLFILPFLVVLSTSLVSENELIRRGNFILIPETFDFTAYKVLLNEKSVILNAYKVTILRVVIGTCANLLFTSMMAYGLSRKNLPGRNAMIIFVFITMLVSGGLIPAYMLLKGMHLIDSFWVMIIPGLVSAWYLIIMKNFFAQIPEELEESAIIDGASPFRILVSIIFPLTLPTYATIGLFYAVGHWNAWFDAVIYINDMHKMPMQAILRQMVLAASSEDLTKDVTAGLVEKPTAQSIKAAAIMIATVPIMCVYPFLQKYFVKGMLTGSIKG